MIIKGKFDTYKVSYDQHGLTYAKPIVYKKKKVPLFGFSIWREVWNGSAKCSETADKMHPEPMKNWFKEAVDEYECYVAAWKNEDSQ